MESISGGEAFQWEESFMETIQKLLSSGVCIWHYYKRIIEEFFDLKLGAMSMEYYGINFMELLRYVGFNKEDKIKNQRFLSGLPTFYKDKIQYDEPKSIEDPIWKDKHLHDQSKGS